MSSGATQRWAAGDYVRNFSFVPDLGLPVLDLLAPRAGERILDLGCGDGALTEKLAAGGASVVGVDASPEMIALAVGRGLDARVVAGEDLTFDVEFDAVFSNAALHWMLKPRVVAANVLLALKPGGRFVGEFGGFGNMAAVRTALHAVLAKRGVEGAALSPWYFPTPDEYRAVLEEAGFAVERVELFGRPTVLKTSMAHWIDMFCQQQLAGFAGAARSAIVAETEDLLTPILRDGAGIWTADYVRLRFAARRPT